MDNRFNTIAGWVLGGGIVLLGASLVSGEYFSADRPEKMGYPIAGVVEEGEGGEAEAEAPIAALLQTADASAGAAVFRRCASCHGIAQGGGGPATGPNLWGTMGAPVAHVAGFSYSEALRGKGGTWTWEAMNEWLRSPRTFAPGTKMTFAGLGDAQDRANIMAYLNVQGSNLPLPPPPAASPAEAAAEQADQPAQGDRAADQPVLNEAAAPPSEGRVKGPAAPDTSGRAAQEPGGH